MADFDELFNVVKIVAVVLVWVVAVLIWKVTDVLPAKTVTVVGTGARLEVLVMAIERPVEGAGDVRVRVAVTDFPPLTEAGLKIRAFTAGG